MNNAPLGKNQMALVEFLRKHPNTWHTVKGRKAISAMRSLSKRYDSILEINGYGQVKYHMPAMLIEQAA